MATDGPDGGVSLGSGSIVRADGVVLTNAHVIGNHQVRVPFKFVSVYSYPGRISGSDKDDLRNRHEATVIAADFDLDLAVLKFRAPSEGLSVIPLAPPESVNIGEAVLAIGHPGGGGFWTLTAGMISSLRMSQTADGRDIYQTDANLNPGNSGGPLLDLEGRLVGVNTSIHRLTGEGMVVTGINFAIQSQAARRWLAKQGYSLAFAADAHPSPPVAELQRAPAPVMARELSLERAPVVEKRVAPPPPPPPPAPRPPAKGGAPRPAPTSAPLPTAVARPPAWKQVTPSRPYDPDAVKRALQAWIKEREGAK